MKKISKTVCMNSYSNFKILKKINTRKFLSALVNKNMAYESCLHYKELTSSVVALLLIKMMFKHRRIFNIGTNKIWNISAKIMSIPLEWVT